MFQISEFTVDAERVIEVVISDMATVKTGRAKPALVEGVTVEAYGTVMKLMELASISAPDPAMLIIQPWDKANLLPIEKGVQAANLGLSAVIDGDQIRISIPMLTQERREEMVKLVKQKLETGKQMLRDVRQKHKKTIDSQKGQPGISEDLIESQLLDLQNEVDVYTQRLETMALDKEKELLQVS